VLFLTLRAGEKTKIGGFELKILKKLNGDKLGFPFLSFVLANAIGLGAIALCKYPCNLIGESSFGSIVSIKFGIFTKIRIQGQWQFEKSISI
jgi:hypothetical protein